ncbi:MAG TPA: beta-ketoacyl synthase N-terminal-like domain-containing protein [Fibrobacteria bacterium]|nr:beta-ketoacyl synthase N-terminal-like domain-containing protein [Fibrobacteria bacterium]
MTTAVITASARMCRESVPVRAGAGTGASSGDWFRPSDYLGPRGYRYQTSSTRYLLAAIKLALDQDPDSPGAYPESQRGVAMGTNFSDYDVREGFDRGILAPGGARNLSPLEAPNSSVNIPASTVSIKHGCKAFSLTLTNPMVAGLEAVLVAAQALATGRARWAAAGACEGTVPERLGGLLACDAGPGAAATLILESAQSAADRKARVLGTLGGCAARFWPEPLWEGGAESRAAIALEKELDRLALPARGSLALALPDHPSAVNRSLRDALTRSLAARGLHAAPVAGPADDGRYAAVSSLLQMQSLLDRSGPGLAAATSPYGHVVLVALHVSG